MAAFSFRGLDELILDMAAVANLPESVQDAMLNAAADVIVPVQRATVRQYGIYDKKSPVHVADSIRKGKVKMQKGARVLYVSATGSRKRGRRETRNSEILFLNEFGTRRQKARPALKDANEASMAAAVQAQEKILDQFYQSKYF